MSANAPKTHKLYINGSFPRSESGRTAPLNDAEGQPIAHISQASKKDLRNAVEAARAAQSSWAAKTPYLRSQIIYRMAEMLDSRSHDHQQALQQQGSSSQAAKEEVQQAIDSLIHYAGWCDKYSALHSSVNPVASAHYNFSVPEPIGVVAAIAPEHGALLQLIHSTLPALLGANAVIAVSPIKHAISAIAFAEVLHTSDLPGGSLNILTGHRDELLPQLASHRNINSLILPDPSPQEHKDSQLASADSLQRLHIIDSQNPPSSLERILAHQELKTTWHPIGI